MKKLLYVVMLFAMAVSMAGCSNQAETTNLSFSDYYKEAEGFDEIRPYLEEYFSYVRSAYEESNKKDIESFKLADGYENSRNALAEFSQSNTDLSETNGGENSAHENYLVKLKLLEPYLQIEMMLNEKDVLLSANKHIENEDWFQRLNTLIWDSIDEYRRGTGE